MSLGAGGWGGIIKSEKEIGAMKHQGGARRDVPVNEGEEETQRQVEEEVF